MQKCRIASEGSKKPRLDRNQLAKLLALVADGGDRRTVCVSVCAGLTAMWSVSFPYARLVSMLSFMDFQKSHQGISLLVEASTLFVVANGPLAAH
jgi:hypothetical protein